MIYMKFFRQ